MTRLHFSTKALSVFLAILLFTLSIPLTVFADTSASESIDTTSPEEAPVLSGLLDEAFEVTSLREETVKHFRLSDGSYMAFQYDSAVHIADDDGNWQDIDNHLTESGSELTSMDARIKFVKKITGNDVIFTLHEGNRKLTTSLDGAIKKTVGEAINTETSFDESATLLQKLTTLDHLSTKVTYRNILDGVDLEYLVNGRNIKENLIVKTADAGNSFSFTLKLNNMTATLADDGAVRLYDGETVCYTIPAPTVWDANGVYANDAYYTLETIGNKSYRLTVTVSDAWMSADDRAYPVTIDPPIISGLTEVDVVDTYISSASPGSYYYANIYNLVSSNYHTYWKIGALPTIPYNAFILNATYNANYWVSEPTSGYIGIYRATSFWGSDLTWNDVNTSNYPEGSIDPHCYDFVKISQQYSGSSSSLDPISWDITELVKKWNDISFPNYGICLKPIDGTVFNGIAKIASNNESIITNRPYICIQYRTMGGVESYWSTVSQSAASAGSGSVNLKQGYLTFAFNGLSTGEAIYPFTPSLVYNSTFAGRSVVNSTHEQAPSGYGWILSTQQAIVPKSSNIDQTYYVWKDGDGTEHAFLPYFRSGGSIIEYYDEDGLGIRLTVFSSDSSAYKYALTTPNSEYLYFDTNGYLVREEDAWGNARRYERNSGGQVTGVYVQPADASSEWKQVTYTYHSTTKLLSSIRYEATGHRFMFYYGTVLGTASLSGSGYLKKIELYTSASDEVTTPYLTVSYEYNSTGLLTSAIDTFNHSRVSYTWSSSRVTGITEYNNSSGSWVQGQAMVLTYQPSGKNETTVRSSGKDDIINNTDDTVTHYVFDSHGRTTNCYVTDVSGTTIYGTTNATYVDTAESGQFLQENRISSQSTVGSTRVNYLKNGTLNTSIDEWTYTGATGTAVKNSDADYAVKLKYTTASSMPSGMFQSVVLVPGTYTFSADIRMLTTSSNTNVKLHVTNATAEGTVATSNILTNNSLVNYYAKYIPLSVTFTVTTQTTYRFYVDISATTASATTYCYVDNLCLTKGEGIDSLSLVEDGGFELHSGSTYTFWSQPGIGTGYSTTEKIEDRNAIRLNGKPGNWSYSKQFITLLNSKDIEQIKANGTVYSGKNQSFVLSGYAKATSRSQVTDSATEAFNGTASTFALAARVWYMNAQGVKDGTDIFLFKFNPYSTDWQFISGTVMFDPAKGHPYQIEVICSYNFNIGTAYFDNIVLTKATNSQLYTYDDNGFIIASVDTTSGIATTYTRNGVDVLSESRSDGVTIHRNYQHHQVTNEWTSVSDGSIEVAQNNYEYNDCGLLIYSDSLASYQEGGSDLAYSQTEYTYSTAPASYGQPDTVITPTGTTRYLYYTSGTSNGSLKAVIGEDGNGTVYTYDALGRQLTAKPATYSSGSLTTLSGQEHANFTYDDGDLVSVSTDSTDYHFAYNTLGNRESVSVGSNKIVRYLYNSYNGKLCYVVYANGYIEKMVYDNLDRLQRICYYEGGNINASDSTIKGYSYTNTAVEYVYNGDGDVSEYIDYIANERYVYRYDVTGRIESICRYYLNGENIVMTNKVSAKYDNQNRLSSTNYAHKIGTSTYNYSGVYGYDILGRVTSYNENSFISTYTYLPIGAMGSQKTTYGSVSVDTAYTYEETDDSGGGLYELTGRVSGATVTVKYSSTQKSQSAYSYTYDAAGNITHIYIGGVLKYSYEYDNLNQLVRENNAVANKTYTYTYDDAGNILTKKTYTYTTGSLGSVQSTNTCGYTNSNWGDQLTSFNGVTMSYDALGNPLQYYNGNSYMFTWQKGRMLTKTVNNNVTTTYTYNADGIRIGKNVGGTAVEYVLDGALILAEKHGDNVVRYFYDASGSPVGMIYGSTTYLFEKNSLGDVIAMWTSGGTKVASYVYDAWGNIISESVSSAHQTASDLNPFRYRSYYYDQETGFYYLQSRYYDPATGRFLNADGYINANGDLQGFNMYAYCSNNPVMNVDYTGEWSWENVFAFGAALTIGALVVIAIIGSGGSAAPPLLAAIGTIVGSSVTAATVSTVAVGVAITGIATMGFATTASLLEASGKPGKDYVQARNNGQANRWAQEVGYENAESLKADFVGRSNGSKFNMYTDRATGEIILIALETLIEIATSLFRW